MLVTSTFWRRLIVYLVCHIFSRLLGISHSFFMFNVQIYLYIHVLFPPSESLQVCPSWRKGCTTMFSGGGDASLVSPACVLRRQLITRLDSVQTSRAFLFCTCGIYNPAWFIPRTFFFHLHLGQDMRTRVFNKNNWNKITNKLIPSICNHLPCCLPATSN